MTNNLIIFFKVSRRILTTTKLKISLLSYVTKTKCEPVFHKKGGNMSKVDLTQNALNDTAHLLFYHFTNNVVAEVKHVIQEILFNISLHRNHGYMLTYVAVYNLNQLFLSTLSSQVESSLIMFSFRLAVKCLLS